MQQIKCKYVTSTVHFWKLRYILPLLECALYSKWNQIMNWYLENTFFVIFFFVVCLYIHKRCPFCLCAEGMQPVQWFSWLSSCSNKRSGQGMYSLMVQFLDWSMGWPTNCLYSTGCRSVDSLAACCFSCSRPTLEKKRWKRVNKLHKSLLAGFEESFHSRNHSSFLVKYWQVTKS